MRKNKKRAHRPNFILVFSERDMLFTSDVHPYTQAIVFMSVLYEFELKYHIPLYYDHAGLVIHNTPFNKKYLPSIRKILRRNTKKLLSKVDYEKYY